ncbi:MAG: carboxymuconolactone decarboxylase family protein [FCB group bacterium]|nr:carboxymuconolactone decarboxylase family protein [FCB group bacterium]
MEEKMTGLISEAFKVFNAEAPEQAHYWRTMVQGLAKSSALDSKTKNLAYLSILAVLGRKNGIPFHVKMAQQTGATRDEVISAVLVGLPLAGHVVTEVLPLAVTAFDTGNQDGNR